MAAKGPDLAPGAMLPGTKYRIVRQIGAGGMGVVYQVVKPPEIQGVLKLMSSDLLEHEELHTRFLDEVRVLAQLDHPNIVKVFDYDKLPDGTPFYVMELLHGRTVRDVLETMGTLPPRVAFEVTRQLLEALHCAHTHDIPVIHRDIKPENIFLHAPRHGEPVLKLIDFGVVAIADRQHDGAFVGTWKYAAPEQIRGERATPATDLYAVGLVLYEMLCGIGPFEDYQSGSLVSQAHLKEIPPPVSKFAPWVPPSIVQLIASALAKEPRQRPKDAYAFAERLFELEWANDGKDANDHTSEGPLSRVLSTVGGAKPSSKNMVAAEPAKDRLHGHVPLIGIPASARHGGPTLKGVGAGGTHEPTSPGEDALLAGLLARPDMPNRSKKARESDPEINDAEKVVIRPGGRVVEIEATPRAAAAAAKRVEAETLDAPKSIQSDTDTFATQESDARVASRRGAKAIPIVLAAMALVVVVSLVGFAAYRARTPSAAAGGIGTTSVLPMAPTQTQPVSQPVAETPGPGSATAVVATVATVAPVASAVPVVGKTARGGGKAAATGVPAAANTPAAPTTVTAPVPVVPAAAATSAAPPKRDDLIRGL